MRKILITSLVAITLFSCTDSTTNKSTSVDTKDTGKEKIERSSFFITKRTNTGMGEEAKEEKETTKFDEKFLDINLTARTDDKWHASKELVSPQVNEEFKMVTILITDKAGELIIFESKTEFLNFMDSKGYEPIESKKEKYKTIFTFKRV